MAAPIGPRRLTKVRQVAIPAVLLGKVGLEIGDEVFFDVAMDDPFVIRIVPAARVVVKPQ